MFSIKEASLLVLTLSLAWILGLARAFPGLNNAWELADSPRSGPLAPYQQTTLTPTTTGQALEISIPLISGPLGGEALQGVLSVAGSVNAVDLVSYEVAFAYQSDPTQTWFLIGQNSGPVDQGTLANWDTTTISDGTYRLRVQMFLHDGQVRETIVEGLRVRNYSLIETSTPAATGDATGEAPLERATPTASSTPLPDFMASERTPVPQATNPVQVDANNLAESAGLGMAMVAGMIVLGGLYFALRALLRR